MLFLDVPFLSKHIPTHITAHQTLITFGTGKLKSMQRIQNTDEDGNGKIKQIKRSLWRLELVLSRMAEVTG